ncbi:hypothetical protein HanRHA438_Chr14g0661121 [Helianthus annuus]|nr:hypothetical protein HanIR_Chr14g0705481 [Helianthus annuus]KAJ0854303.1 hypothetical protein HanRHA438_Chr14g0661121 [Helianthus annuus]
MGHQADPILQSSYSDPVSQQTHHQTQLPHPKPHLSQQFLDLKPAHQPHLFFDAFCQTLGVQDCKYTFTKKN